MDPFAIVNRIHEEGGFTNYDAYDEIWELIWHLQIEMDLIPEKHIDGVTWLKTWDCRKETPPDGWYWFTSGTEITVTQVIQIKDSLATFISDDNKVVAVCSLGQYKVQGPIPPPDEMRKRKVVHGCE